jgi:hypothetical protein
MNKCPKCDKIVTHVNLTAVEVIAGADRWKGVSYGCPWCYAVLSVSIDPIALKTDIVAEVKKLLQR